MNWEQFIQAVAAHNSIDVIGPFGKKWIPSERPAIFVDGGVKYRMPCPLSISVGDGDSTTMKLDIVLQKEKDFSDLCFVLQSLPSSIQEVYLHGFLGERLDHQLANFGEIHAFLKSRLMPCFALMDREAIVWSKGAWDFNWKGRFSLFTLEGTAVQVTGQCKYQLSQPTILPPLSSIGLSNDATGTIQVKTEGPVFCFYGTHV